MFLENSTELSVFEFDGMQKPTGYRQQICTSTCTTRTNIINKTNYVGAREEARIDI